MKKLNFADTALHDLRTLLEYQEYLLEVSKNAEVIDTAKESQELIQKIMTLIKKCGAS